MKGIAIRIAGILFGILLGLSLIELLLRMFGSSGASFARPDKIIGFSFIPGAYYKFHAPEDCPGWGSEGYINSHGLRDHDYDYPKPAGTFRILALGDSFSEALQHPLDATWTKLLEGQLNATGDGHNYQVINAGRSGMGTSHEYLFFAHEGYRYSPDLVILQVYSNDISDNSEELSNSGDSGPFFNIVSDRLALDDRFNQSLSFKIKSMIEPIKAQSYLISAVTGAYQSFTQNASNLALESSLKGGKVPVGAIENALNITQRLIVALDQAVLNTGARLVVFNISDKSIAGPAQLNQSLTDVTNSHGIPYYDLSPAMNKYGQLAGTYMFGCAENNGAGHWSRAGHLEASKLMYAFLVGQNLLPK